MGERFAIQGLQKRPDKFSKLPVFNSPLVTTKVFAFSSGGRQQEQQQWRVEQPWQQRQLLEQYGEWHEQRLEPELQQ
jgi:hypothetical protein